MILPTLKKIFSNTSISLALIIIFSLLLGNKLPSHVISFFYSISLSMKEILIFILPAVIFTYLASCILSLKEGAVTFLLILISMVVFSNFISILVAYIAHMTDLISVAPRRLNAASLSDIIPLWDLRLWPWIGNDQALFLGLIIGIIFTYKRVENVERFINILKSSVDFFMNRLFVPALPLFILGFVLKLRFEGLLGQILQDYAPVLGVIIGFQILYLITMFGIASKFHPKKWVDYMRNILPATLAGFTSMSSAAAMPISIQSAEKNIGDPEMARAIIPATLNIHMIGDSIGIPIMMMVILRTFGFDTLSFADYLMFTGYFMMAKFAIAAVPGGSILVIVPILENNLNFTSEMSALITALYILFDPIITAANVSGNGAFAILFHKIIKRPLTPTSVS